MQECDKKNWRYLVFITRYRLFLSLTECFNLIADLHGDNRNFLEGIIKYGTPVIGGALLLGAAILGVNVKGTKLPTINGKK